MIFYTNQARNIADNKSFNPETKRISHTIALLIIKSEPCDIYAVRHKLPFNSFPRTVKPKPIGRFRGASVEISCRPNPTSVYGVNCIVHRRPDIENRRGASVGVQYPARNPATFCRKQYCHRIQGALVFPYYVITVFTEKRIELFSHFNGMLPALVDEVQSTASITDFISKEIIAVMRKQEVKADETRINFAIDIHNECLYAA